MLNFFMWLLFCNLLMSQWVFVGIEDLYIGIFYDVNVLFKGWSFKGVMLVVWMVLDYVNKNQFILLGYMLYEDFRDFKVSRRYCVFRKFQLYGMLF